MASHLIRMIYFLDSVLQTNDTTASTTSQNEEDIWSVATVAFPFIFPLAALTLLYGQRGIITRFLLQFNMNCVSALCPSLSQRERILKWAGGRLPPTWSSSTKTFAAGIVSFWQDGSLLCTLINSAIPNACPNPHRHWCRPPSHGQALAYKYLGVTPVFTEDEFSQTSLSLNNERKLLNYITCIEQAVSNIVKHDDPEILKYTSKYIARGMGLITGEQYRKTSFYIYSKSKKKTDIIISVRGPYGTYGTITVPFTLKTYNKKSIQNQISGKLNEIKKLGYKPAAQKSFFRTLSVELNSLINSFQNQEIDRTIPIYFHTENDRIKVIYIPAYSGIHELCMVVNGNHLLGSPFNIRITNNTSGILDENIVETAKDKQNLKRKGKILSKVIDFIDKKVIIDQNITWQNVSHEFEIKKDNVKVTVLEPLKYNITYLKTKPPQNEANNLDIRKHILQDQNSNKMNKQLKKQYVPEIIIQSEQYNQIDNVFKDTNQNIQIASENVESILKLEQTSFKDLVSEQVNDQEFNRNIINQNNLDVKDLATTLIDDHSFNENPNAIDITFKQKQIFTENANKDNIIATKSCDGLSKDVLNTYETTTVQIASKIKQNQTEIVIKTKTLNSFMKENEKYENLLESKNMDVESKAHVQDQQTIIFPNSNEEDENKTSRLPTPYNTERLLNNETIITHPINNPDLVLCHSTRNNTDYLPKQYQITPDFIQTSTSNDKSTKQKTVITQFPQNANNKQNSSGEVDSKFSTSCSSVSSHISSSFLVKQQLENLNKLHIENNTEKNMRRTKYELRKEKRIDFEEPFEEGQENENTRTALSSQENYFIKQIPKSNKPNNVDNNQITGNTSAGLFKFQQENDTELPNLDTGGGVSLVKTLREQLEALSTTTNNNFKSNEDYSRKNSSFTSFRALPDPLLDFTTKEENNLEVTNVPCSKVVDSFNNLDDHMLQDCHSTLNGSLENAYNKNASNDTFTLVRSLRDQLTSSTSELNKSVEDLNFKNIFDERKHYWNRLNSQSMSNISECLENKAVIKSGLKHYPSSMTGRDHNQEHEKNQRKEPIFKHNLEHENLTENSYKKTHTNHFKNKITVTDTKRVEISVLHNEDYNQNQNVFEEIAFPSIKDRQIMYLNKSTPNLSAKDDLMFQNNKEPKERQPKKKYLNQTNNNSENKVTANHSNSTQTKLRDKSVHPNVDDQLQLISTVNTTDDQDKATKRKMKSKFQKTQLFFKSLEQNVDDRYKNKSQVTDEMTVRRRHSLDIERKINKKSKIGGSLTNVSERFLINNLYNDVFGQKKGSFKGSPNRAAVADTLASYPINYKNNVVNSEDDVKLALFIKQPKFKQRKSLKSVFNINY